MAEVRLNDGENFDSLLKRFHRRIQQDSILSEIRKRQFFEPPSSVRKRQAEIKKRKSTKGVKRSR